MGATQAIVSIGDEGVLNVQVSPSLADVWICLLYTSPSPRDS